VPILDALYIHNSWKGPIEGNRCIPQRTWGEQPLETKAIDELSYEAD
jgi:hypothetical protein